MGLGLLLLFDVVNRSGDLALFYSNGGVLPIAELYQQYPRGAFWSLYALHGSATFAAVLFAVTAISALGLFAGFKTRWMSFLSWLLCASLQNRNPIVLNAGDVMLLALLFWSMFLPLGARWSLDRAFERGKNELPAGHYSVAGAAVQIQFALMYIFAGLYKCNSVWFSGEAMQHVLSHDTAARPLAYWLLEYPILLKLVSYLTPLAEISLPLLCFVPWATGRIRCLVILIAFGFHLSIELAITTGLFAYVSMIGWMLFLPDGFWNRLERFLPKHALGLKMKERTGPSSVAPGGERAASTPKSPWRTLYEAGLLALLLYVVIYNIDLWQRRSGRFPVMPAFAHKIASATRLAQVWEMFSKPETTHGWFIVTGHTADGRKVDLIRNEFDPDDERRVKPEYPYRQFPNHRWRKYFSSLPQSPSGERNPTLLCRALGNQWNGLHDPKDAIIQAEIEFLTELPSTDLHLRRERSLYHVEPITAPRQ